MRFKPKLRETRWDIRKEEEIWRKWAASNLFKFNVKSKKKLFTIDTPPPYPKPI